MRGLRCKGPKVRRRGRQRRIDRRRRREAGRRRLWRDRECRRRQLRMPPRQHHLPRIGQAERGGLGMVVGRRNRPVPGHVEKVAQEGGAVSRVGRRIERSVQAREGMRVVHQVHLQAADVDRLHALGLQVLDGRDRIGLGGEELAGAAHVDGPRPRPRPAGGIGPAAFDDADRRQQAGRDVLRPLRRPDRVVTRGEGRKRRDGRDRQRRSRPRPHRARLRRARLHRQRRAAQQHRREADYDCVHVTIIPASLLRSANNNRRGQSKSVGSHGCRQWAYIRAICGCTTRPNERS